jgi:futalosine hydrolase
LAVELVVCVATELEGILLRPHVPIIVTGIGAVNAAMALTRFLEHEGARAVISCGIGGAFPPAFDTGELTIGSAVCAESECYGDLGADSPGGFLDLRDLGFPLIAATAPVFNTLPFQLFPAPKRAKFVTINTCSGTDEGATALARRTGASVENMEGAAIAHVAAAYQIPAGEIRGISNRAGMRDRASWRTREAAEAAQIELLRWLSAGLHK